MGNITQVTTGKVRLSYAHLFQPYAYQQGQEAKYSTTILVPKSDIATKQRIDAALQAAVQAGISEKWNGMKPPILAIPVYDGDGVRPSDGMAFGPEFKGHWVFTASSKNPIAVVDTNMNPIINQSDVYSGIYARVSVQFFAYNSNGKKGVGCGLGPVQKLEDGEPLGGGISAEAAFGGQNAFPAQPTYQQPAQQIYQQPLQMVSTPQSVAYESQPYYAQQQQAPQQTIDPITGAPIGGVMGI